MVQRQSTDPAPHVAILMCTFNGASFIQEQLDSIATQTHQNWTLFVSDDGSTDDTLNLIEDFAAKGHQVTLFDGPKEGGAENYMSLLRKMDISKTAMLAFCDQDDVWTNDRLARGIDALDTRPADVPALYCSGLWVTDDTLSNPRLYEPRRRTPGFRNALVQNIASGNTVLLNTSGAKLAIGQAAQAGQVVVHDWWLYQLVTGAGGSVIHDPEPTIYYRQHGQNQIGANDSVAAKRARLRMVLHGQFKAWNDTNIAALTRSKSALTPENAELLEQFARLRTESFWKRLKGFARMGLYRQSPTGNLTLWVAILFRKL